MYSALPLSDFYSVIRRPWGHGFIGTSLLPAIHLMLKPNYSLSFMISWGPPMSSPLPAEVPALAMRSMSLLWCVISKVQERQEHEDKCDNKVQKLFMVKSFASIQRVMIPTWWTPTLSHLLLFNTKKQNLPLRTFPIHHSAQQLLVSAPHNHSPSSYRLEKSAFSSCTCKGNIIFFPFLHRLLWF